MKMLHRMLVDQSPVGEPERRGDERSEAPRSGGSSAGEREVAMETRSGYVRLRAPASRSSRDLGRTGPLTTRRSTSIDLAPTLRRGRSGWPTGTVRMHVRSPRSVRSISSTPFLISHRMDASCGFRIALGAPTSGRLASSSAAWLSRRVAADPCRPQLVLRTPGAGADGTVGGQVGLPIGLDEIGAGALVVEHQRANQSSRQRGIRVGDVSRPAGGGAVSGVGHRGYTNPGPRRHARARTAGSGVGDCADGSKLIGPTRSRSY